MKKVNTKLTECPRQRTPNDRKSKNVDKPKIDKK